jgi:hypothetical protein
MKQWMKFRLKGLWHWAEKEDDGFYHTRCGKRFIFGPTDVAGGSSIPEVDQLCRYCSHWKGVL